MNDLSFRQNDFSANSSMLSLATMSSTSSVSSPNLSFDHESLFKEVDNELEQDCEKMEKKKKKAKRPTTPTYRAHMQIIQLKVRQFKKLLYVRPKQIRGLIFRIVEWSKIKLLVV